MSFPIPGISIAGISGIAAPGGVSSAAAGSSSSAADFASVLASSLDQLQGAQSKADGLATQAATGDLRDVHDYMIASNEARLATEMVVAVKNQAVSAFNEIMRMQV